MTDIDDDEDSGRSTIVSPPPADSGGGLLQEGLEKASEYTDEGLEAIGVPEPVSDVLGAGTQEAVKALDPKNIHSAMTSTAAGFIGKEAARALGASDAVAGAVGSAAAKGMKKLYDLGGDLDAAGGGASGAASAASSAAGGSSGGVGGVVSSVASAVAAALTSDDPGNVEAVFECDGTADVEWEVVEAVVTEELDAPFEVRLKLRTDEMSAEPAMVLGSGCTLMVRRNDQEQRWVGLAAEVLEGSSSEDHVTAEVLVVPALWMLGRRRDTRIFQEKTVPQILEEVLGTALGDFEREARFQLDRSNYPTCEYRVQYDETDLDFAHRLMQEEGIVYWFDHEGEKEVVVLIDTKDQHEPVDRPDGASIQFAVFGTSGGNREVVTELHRRSTVLPTRVKTRHWDWTRADFIEGEQEGEPPGGSEPFDGAASAPAREEYDQDNRPLTLHQYDPGARSYQANDVDDQGRLRRELQARDARVGEGNSTVIAMRPGRTFELTGHRQAELDAGYLLTRVAHRYIGSGPEAERYTNRFRCLPQDVPFRPSRRAVKPRIGSIQTAVVVGPSGEEVHTDEHGRIKVQFHWDRLGANDEHSSCWMRVMQPWAGPGWGAFFIPRIGMEVVVTFVNGDPDLPLVTGSVYNGRNATPYPMPDSKSKSTLKTQSLGGAGYNEITFDDAGGSEQILVHAQKDYTETVEHDHATTVHNNQTQTVDVDQTESVGANQTMSVGGNRTVTVDGEQKFTIKGGLSKLDVTGDYKVDVSNVIEIQAPTHIKLTCGGSTILMEPGKITLEAGGKSKVVLDANVLVESSQHSTVKLDANAQMQSSGNSTVLLDANAKMESSGGSKVQLDANVLAESSGKSKVELTGDALMKGNANATVQGTAEATVTAPTSKLVGGGGMVEAAGAGVTAAGGQVNISGGTVNVSGGMVKIN